MRNADAAFAQLIAYLRIVEQARGNPRIRFAGMAAAGAAIEARGIGIVDRAAAMSSQQDQAREVAGHRHCAQHGLGHCQPLFVVEATDAASDQARFQAWGEAIHRGGIEPVGRGLRRRTGEAERVADDLCGEQQSVGFYEGERRHCGQLEKLPGLGRALAQRSPPQQPGFVAGTGASDGFANGECRLQQHRALRIASCLAQRHIFDRVAEEAGEAQGFKVGRDCFQCAPEHFGAHVDAEHRLHRLARVRWRRCRVARRANAFDQPALGCSFIGLVHGQVDSEFGIDSGFFMRLPAGGQGERVRPGRLEARIGAVAKQGVAPDQANGQQVDDPLVAAPMQRVVPSQVAHMAGPSGDVEQGPMQVVVQRT